jgi:hypothetical protein
MIIQCHLDHGSRSIRAGICVVIVLSVGACACAAIVLLLRTRGL